jgi:hypothetical protein
MSPDHNLRHRCVSLCYTNCGCQPEFESVYLITKADLCFPLTSFNKINIQYIQQNLKKCQLNQCRIIENNCLGTEAQCLFGY